MIHALWLPEILVLPAPWLVLQYSTCMRGCGLKGVDGWLLDLIRYCDHHAALKGMIQVHTVNSRMSWNGASAHLREGVAS